MVAEDVGSRDKVMSDSEEEANVTNVPSMYYFSEGGSMIPLHQSLSPHLSRDP